MNNTFESFCNRIDNLLSRYKVRRLSSKEINRYKSFGCSVGWILITELIQDGERVSLALLIKQSFPYSRPLLFVYSPQLKPLSYPHIESEGKLCVWPDTFIPDLCNCDYIVQLIIDATDLLYCNFKGLHKTHFHEEFTSYWFYHSERKKFKAICLCDPEYRQSREIYVFNHGSRCFIFADSLGELESLLDNRSLLPTKKNKSKRKRALGKIRPTALFSLETPWTPKEYPNTCGELIKLLEAQSGDSLVDILQLITATLKNPFTETPCCLLSLNTPTGYCFAGIVFNQSLTSKNNHNSVRDGYRKTMPDNVFQARVSNIGTYGAYVSRIDHSWVTGRDNNPDSKELQKCGDIVIVGCGSVGGAVARLLVQAGIENLVLFDSDNLQTENISRHNLGYEGVSHNKAEYLAYSLRRDFPYAKIRAINKTWQDAKINDDKILAILKSSELIVSCTADWYSDQGLLTFQSEYSLVPIIFSFTEAHAMAAHVIVNPCDSDAYNSLHIQEGEKVGGMKMPVTSWINETTKKIPACGGTFQPYGIVPLTHLHALTAETVLGLLLGNEEPEPFRYVWFGSKQHLVALNGAWSKEWCGKYGDPGNGRTVKKYVLHSEEWEYRDY